MKILIPALAFALLLIFFVSRLPRPRSATISVVPTPAPILNASPTPLSSLQILTDEIRSFRLDDPELAAPTFSRSLDIPAE